VGAVVGPFVGSSVSIEYVGTNVFPSSNGGFVFGFLVGLRVLSRFVGLRLGLLLDF